MKRPRGIEEIHHIYAPDISACLPDGRYVAAVAEPYATNFFERVRAAWWVLTGHAVAFIWPKAGDLERAFRCSQLARRS